MLKAVSAVSRVTLVSYTASARQVEDIDVVRSWCEEVHIVPPHAWGEGKFGPLPRVVVRAMTAMECLDPREPSYLPWYRSAEAEALVARLCRRQFDLVWAERMPALRLLPKKLRARVFLDKEDLDYRKMSYRIRRVCPTLLSPLEALDYFKMRRMELGITRLPYGIGVCSTVDWEILGRSRAELIPNGVNVPATASPPPDCDVPVFVFTGLMSYAPNDDGVRYFVRCILPLIRRELPEALFIIAGRDPTGEVRRLHDGCRVIVTGSPSVGPHLARACAVVVPLRFGGGTKYKVLEGLAQCKPVVSTSIGSEGIDIDADRHYLLADEPETFARACIRVFRDAALRRRLASAGYERVSERYRWSIIERQVQSIVLNGAEHATASEE